MAAARIDYRVRVRAATRILAGEDPQAVAESLGRPVDEVTKWSESFIEGGTAQVRRDFPPSSSQPRFPRPDPQMALVAEALEYAKPKAQGNTFGTYLSNALAVVFANGLRRRNFDGVLPDSAGGFESRVRSARGLKKLDVNYSTPEMGLGLGLSIKTISSRDPETGRYTKNYSRNDNELRAEAVDYHRRQPFAVLAGFLFMPIDAADDAGTGRGDGEDDPGISSFGAAVRYFRYRTPRPAPDAEPDLFEAFFVALYEPGGEAVFWPVHDLDLDPPAGRRPYADEVLDLDGALEEVVELYDRRNNPPFSWSKR